MAGELLYKVGMAVDITGTPGNEIIYSVPLTVDITGAPGAETIYPVSLTVDITGAPGVEIIYPVSLTVDVTTPTPPPPEEKDFWDKIQEYWYVPVIGGFVIAGVVALWPKEKAAKGIGKGKSPSP